MMAGMKMVQRPYKGSSQAMTDLIAGRTSLMFVPAPTALTADEVRQRWLRWHRRNSSGPAPRPTCRPWMNWD